MPSNSSSVRGHRPESWWRAADTAAARSSVSMVPKMRPRKHLFSMMKTQNSNKKAAHFKPRKLTLNTAPPSCVLMIFYAQCVCGWLPLPSLYVVIGLMPNAGLATYGQHCSSCRTHCSSCCTHTALAAAHTALAAAHTLL